MKKKSIILALSMTLIIGAGATAYAGSNSPSVNNMYNRACTSIGTGIGRITNLSGHDILSNLLKSKGVTEDQITTALNSGKSMYDLLKEKGVSDTDIKSYMLNERIQGIDKAVSEGSITKDQGEEMKSNIKENPTNCTPGQGNGGMRGRGNGNMYRQNVTN